MKKALASAILLLFIYSCNNERGTAEGKPPASKDSAGMTAAAPTEKPDYAYTPSHPYQNWQQGDPHHAVMVMKSLKAYENGDIETSLSAFGDSVQVRFDGYFAKLSHDSLKNMLQQSRDQLASQKIEMNDWESVISQDKRTEYVTLWYKEVNTDKKGKTDSINVVDDLRIANGKIVELDQKIQHFPRPMAKKI